MRSERDSALARTARTGHGEDLAQCFAGFALLSRPLSSWPEPGSPPEEGLLECAIFLFLNPGRSTRSPGGIARTPWTGQYVWATDGIPCVCEDAPPLAGSLPGAGSGSDTLIQSNLQAHAGRGTALGPCFSRIILRNSRRPLPVARHRFRAGRRRNRCCLPFWIRVPSEWRFSIPITGFCKANQVLCRLLGYLEHELEALSLPAIAHPQDIGDYHPSHGPGPERGPRPRPCGKASPEERPRRSIWVELTAAAVCREDGSPLYSLVFIEDITERKQEEDMRHDEKHLFERLLQNNQEGIFTFDRDLVCTSGIRPWSRSSASRKRMPSAHRF